MKEKNPEVVASHLILTSGVGHYYPNGKDVYLLPPVSELDLRDTNNYILASPKNDPKRSTVWVPVYFDDVGNGLITTVTSPIYGPDGRFYGVAGLDVPVSRIEQQVIKSMAGTGSEKRELFPCPFLAGEYFPEFFIYTIWVKNQQACAADFLSCKN